MKRQPQYRDAKFENEGWTKKNEAFAMADSNQARNKVSQMANKKYKIVQTNFNHCFSI